MTSRPAWRDSMAISRNSPSPSPSTPSTSRRLSSDAAELARMFRFLDIRTPVSEDYVILHPQTSRPNFSRPNLIRPQARWNDGQASRPARSGGGSEAPAGPSPGRPDREGPRVRPHVVG